VGLGTAKLRTQRAPLLLAILAVALTAVDYTIAFATDVGLRADEAAIARGFVGPEWQQARAATLGLVQTIDISSLAVVGAAVVGLALLRGRPRQAVWAAIVIAGANLTTQVLKPLLAQADPLGGETERALTQHFPSGHATVSMSVPLALMLAVSPGWRGAAALAAFASSATIGIGMLLIGWHFPSDVLAGYLVAAAWAGVAAAALNSWAPAEGRATRARGSREVTAAIAAMLLVAVLVLIAFSLRQVDVSRLHLGGRFQLAFIAAAALVALAAAAVPATLRRLLDDHPDSVAQAGTVTIGQQRPG